MFEKDFIGGISRDWFFLFIVEGKYCFRVKR